MRNPVRASEACVRSDAEALADRLLHEFDAVSLPDRRAVAVTMLRAVLQCERDDALGQALDAMELTRTQVLRARHRYIVAALAVGFVVGVFSILLAWIWR